MEAISLSSRTGFDSLCPTDLVDIPIFFFFCLAPYNIAFMFRPEDRASNGMSCTVHSCSINLATVRNEHQDGVGFLGKQQVRVRLPEVPCKLSIAFLFSVYSQNVRYIPKVRTTERNET